MFLFSLHKHIIDHRVFLRHTISDKLAVAKSFLQLIYFSTIYCCLNNDEWRTGSSESNPIFILSTCSTQYLISPYLMKMSQMIFFSFLRRKRYKCMQAAGVFPPCSVQPLLSVTQPETHTAHCRPVTRHSQNKEHTHCHLREKFNMDDNTEAAFWQNIKGLWIGRVWHTVQLHVLRHEWLTPATCPRYHCSSGRLRWDTRLCVYTVTCSLFHVRL